MSQPTTNTFILFLSGSFEDHQEVEYFCLDILAESPVVKTLRYVIENQQNIIVIFESDAGFDELVTELHKSMDNHTVKYYFIFDRNTIVAAHIPEEIRDFIFKPIDENQGIKVEFIKKEKNMNLDDLLDKIEKFGVNSLTIEEKNFLDNFDK